LERRRSAPNTPISNTVYTPTIKEQQQNQVENSSPNEKFLFQQSKSPQNSKIPTPSNHKSSKKDVKQSEVTFEENLPQPPPRSRSPASMLFPAVPPNPPPTAIKNNAIDNDTGTGEFMNSLQQRFKGMELQGERNGSSNHLSPKNSKNNLVPRVTPNTTPVAVKSPMKIVTPAEKLAAKLGVPLKTNGAQAQTPKSQQSPTHSSKTKIIESNETTITQTTTSSSKVIKGKKKVTTTAAQATAEFDNIPMVDTEGMDSDEY